LFRLIPNGDGALFPVLNDMARWRTMQLGRQIEDYEAYQEEHGEKVASSTYKLSWFDGKPPKSAEDLDSIDNKNLTNNMIAFLNRYVTHATPMKEGSDEFNAFSSQLKSYFKQLNPGDPSISRSKKRKEWGHASINNHLKPFNTDTGNCYELVEEPLKNTWVLKNRINEQTSSE